MPKTRRGDPQMGIYSLPSWEYPQSSAISATNPSTLKMLSSAPVRAHPLVLEFRTL